MFVSQSVYSVGHNNSFIVVRREDNFINFFCINLMTMTSYDIHFSMLFLPAKQTLSIVIELHTPFVTFFVIPLTFFIFSVIKHFVRVQFSSQTNKFNNLIPISFILKHSKHFTIKSCFNSRWMIDWLIKIKLCLLHVNGDEIFIEDRTTIIVWLVCQFWTTLSDVINRISTLFLRFSSVLPPAELFINLKKIYFKVVSRLFSLYPQLRGQITVFFQPSTFFEFNTSMNL